MWLRNLFLHRKSVQKLCHRTFINPKVTKERLLSEYQRATAFVNDKKLPDDVNKFGIFANDELCLDEINVYGFDYDYTLAAYKKATVEKMLHSLAKKALVTDLQYPEEMANFEYDPNLTIRGLHYDIKNGLLLKVNSVLQVQSDAVFRGRKKLSEGEVNKIYPAKRLTLEMLEPRNPAKMRFVHLVDNFAKPVMCLLCDVIQWFVENDINYEPESIYMDVRASIDKAHPLFHLAAASDPKIILEKDPELKIMLERLKTEGKTTFLMTNSPFDIVNAGMTYMFDENWRSLFDIVIVNAKKPSFFTAAGRHFRVYSPKTGRLKWQKVATFREQRIYSGGNYENLVDMTQWQPNSVLYFGDHPYADLADLSMVHGWRTCAIIEDLEDEIDKLNGPQMKMLTNWTNVLQGLLDNYQDSLHDEASKALWYEWKDELDQFRLEMKSEFNENFGSVFRSKKNPTFFSRRLFRVADVYTSRVTNFNNFPLGHTFYPRRGALPHEFKSWFV